MSELPRRMLGRTGLNVTTLGYGAMELRGAPSGPAVADTTAEKVLNAVLDADINFIDTSIDYGQSEELIGRLIAHRRREYFLASKCGCVPGARMGASHVPSQLLNTMSHKHLLRRAALSFRAQRGIPVSTQNQVAIIQS